MNYQLLGDTGLLVSELCMGTMTFGGDGYWKHIGEQTQDEADELIQTAIDAGVNFIDTANIYSYGQSERILGQSLRNLGISRDEVVVASKVRGAMDDGPNQQGLSRYHVMHSVDRSLERLKLDHLDILYVHGVDSIMPVEEIMHTLNDLVASGRVRYLGVSNWPAWMIMKAQGIADRRGWHQFKAMQHFYSLSGRDAEDELLPFAKSENLAFMPWSPLAGGFLSGKYTRKNQNTGGGSRRDDFDFPPIDKDQAFDIVDVLKEIGEEHDVSAAEIALAWVRLQAGVTSTIIGAKNMKQLTSNLHSANIELSKEELDELSEVSAIPARYPHWMIERQMGSRFPEEQQEA